MSKYVDLRFIHLISYRLRNFKQKKEDVFNFSCPYCLDSKTNLRKARFYIYENEGKLYGKCHNCGKNVGIGNLIKHVDPSLYEEYVLESYKEKDNWNFPKKTAINNIAPVKFDKISRKELIGAEYCDELSSNHFCIKYLKSRLIPKKFYKTLLYTDDYKEFILENFPSVELPKGFTGDKRLVIPFYNEYDEFIATAGRALESSQEKLRYLTVRGKDFREKLIFGMDRVNLDKHIKIVEGPIDSLFLSNCIASGDANLELVAKELNRDNVTLIFDNERRNKEIVHMMEKSLKSGFRVVVWPDYIHEKDINKMIESGLSAKDIESIIHTNTFSGIKGVYNLNLWKRI